jgi:hypothetical protein
MSFSAAWNDGIVESWNTGYKKRKTKSFIKNVESTFFNDARQTLIFCFYPEKYAIKT